MNQLTIFDLEAFTKSPATVSDPAWDEIETAPQHSEKNVGDRNSPWDEWELRVRAQISTTTTVKPCVGAQVEFDTTVKPCVGAQVEFDTTVETCVGAQVLDITEKVAPQHDTHWVEKYWVERSGNKYWYYRYCWMTGRKKNRRYLGSVNSKLAKRKRADIEVWISDGYSPSEIVKLIQSWGEDRKHTHF